MVEIPVEVETPDHCYYHVCEVMEPLILHLHSYSLSTLLVIEDIFICSIVQIAFFTTRKVDALEELNWVSIFYLIRLYLLVVCIWH